jgi:hypothetical protein
MEGEAVWLKWFCVEGPSSGSVVAWKCPVVVVENVKMVMVAGCVTAVSVVLEVGS